MAWAGKWAALILKVTRYLDLAFPAVQVVKSIGGRPRSD
jgi:hypothetical protein